MKKTILIIALIFVVLCSFNVMGVGIMGADLKKTIQFSPDKQETLAYYALSDAKEGKSYTPFAKPMPDAKDISEYIVFEPSSFTIKPKGQKQFKAKIKLPFELDAGKHGAQICIKESQGSQGPVGVTTSACAFVYVNVEGKVIPKPEPKKEKNRITIDTINEKVTEPKKQEKQEKETEEVKEPVEKPKKTSSIQEAQPSTEKKTKKITRALALVVAALSLLIIVRKSIFKKK